MDVKKPSRLCAPVDVDGAQPGAGAHRDYLMCYRVKATSFERVGPLYAASTIGSLTLDAIKPAEVCVPAVSSP